MSSKIPVQFRKSVVTRHAFERLKHCKGCGSYSVLWHDRCLKCGAEGKFQSLQELVGTVRRRGAWRDSMIVFSICLAAFFLAESGPQMILSIAGGFVLAAGYLLLNRKYAPSIEKRLLHQLLAEEHRSIRDGLLLDVEDAGQDLKAGEYKLAYEKLREIGYLIQGNQVKVLKLMCLNHFILRRDMELELSELIPDDFDKEFVRYLHEVSKVNPQLIKSDTLSYVWKYRVLIEALPEGRETLALAASAALRVKAYVLQYQELVTAFIDELPRDRLLRLSRLLQDSQNEAPELYARTRDIVQQKYGSDPEFQAQGLGG
ncbi:hypothetical protein [Paenibacillus sp. OAS669]|uniref:hypothetical protein n=1 Tax=Paenibacillus sp. OAS669 TaxID=2663821 RepID=UPI00178B6C08|nr:hypothetical protein [Paenibacillus sp. OAS669]MBE1446518.1 hypothetical protein [Paenibacillus sp. OAS669]